MYWAFPFSEGSLIGALTLKKNQYLERENFKLQLNFFYCRQS